MNDLVLRRHQRRTVATLIVAQVLGGLGLASGIAVGTLIAADLLADRALSGLPFALSVGGTTAAAIPLSRLMRRFGRRIGLRLAWIVGALGAALIASSVVLGLTPLFLAGMALFGGASAGADAARYAATDLAMSRGRAMGTLVFATTLAAIGGPLLLAPAADAATAVGVPAFAGPFALSAVAFAAAAVILDRFLRPDPLLLAATLRLSADEASATSADAASRPGPATGSGRPRAAIAGAVAMGTVSFAMILAMVAAPGELDSGGSGLGAIGLVVALHIAAMFAPSPLSGWLADRFGPGWVIGLGGAAMAGTALLFVRVAGAGGAGHAEHGGHGSVDTAPELAAALVLLGVAWNLGFMGGSAQLAASLSGARLVSAQGVADAAMGLAGLTGALLSGVVVAVVGSVGIVAVASGAAAVLVVTGALTVATTRRPPQRVASTLAIRARSSVDRASDFGPFRWLRCASERERRSETGRVICFLRARSMRVFAATRRPRGGVPR
jgi:MFS family permease